MKKKLENVLYESFDRKLSSDEQACLNESLERSEELRLEFENAKKTRTALKELKFTGDFSENFTDSILDRLNHYSNGFNENLIIQFKRLSLVAAILIFLMTGYELIISDRSMDLLSESNRSSIVESIDTYMENELYGDEQK